MDRCHITLLSRSSGETEDIGRRIGQALGRGDLVFLRGELGAGKTCLARGIARGLGVDADLVSSPTFVLAHEHNGRIPMYHLDLYRLRDLEEFRQAGLDNYISGRGVAVIEWPEIVGDAYGYERLEIAMEYHDDPDLRAITVLARGPRYHRVIQEMGLC